MVLEAISILLIWFLGASLASFYGVVATRVPQGRSIIRPGSICDNCQRKLDLIDLTPVLGYFLRRGKCKTCGFKVSLLYPTTEFFYGGVFVASYLHWGRYFFLESEFIYFFVVSSLLLISILTDILHRKLLLVSNVLLGVVGLVLTIASKDINIFYRLLETLGVLVFLLFIYFLHEREGLGKGDIQFYTAFTLVFGVSITIVVLFVSSALSILLTLPHIKGRQSFQNYKVPFGAYTAFVVLVFFTLSVFDIAPVIPLFSSVFNLYQFVLS